MHDSAYALMERELNALHFDPACSVRVLDVGSYDVNGSLKPLVEARGWEYLGLDVRPGANVDVVSEPYSYPFTDGSFEVVMSACALHNIPAPWRLFPELARVLKGGGVLIVHGVWSWGVNEHPADYFRVMPDGMQVLFDLCACFENERIAIENEHDVLGVVWKQK